MNVFFVRTLNYKKVLYDIRAQKHLIHSGNDKSKKMFASDYTLIDSPRLLLRLFLPPSGTNSALSLSLFFILDLPLIRSLSIAHLSPILSLFAIFERSLLSISRKGTRQKVACSATETNRVLLYIVPIEPLVFDATVLSLITISRFSRSSTSNKMKEEHNTIVYYGGKKKEESEKITTI